MIFINEDKLKIVKVQKKRKQRNGKKFNNIGIWAKFFCLCLGSVVAYTTKKNDKEDETFKFKF